MVFSYESWHHSITSWRVKAIFSVRGNRRKGRLRQSGKQTHFLSLYKRACLSLCSTGRSDFHFCLFPLFNSWENWEGWKGRAVSLPYPLPCGVIFWKLRNGKINNPQVVSKWKLRQARLHVAKILQQIALTQASITGTKTAWDFTGFSFDEFREA